MTTVSAMNTPCHAIILPGESMSVCNNSVERAASIPMKAPLAAKGI